MNSGLSLQWAGIILAAVTFITIAVGHVLVRRLHARFGTHPAVPFFITGAVVLLASILVHNNLLSAVLGLTAITLIWDGIEIYRQEKRMLRERATQ